MEQKYTIIKKYSFHIQRPVALALPPPLVFVGGECQQPEDLSRVGGSSVEQAFVPLRYKRTVVEVEVDVLVKVRVDLHQA